MANEVQYLDVAGAQWLIDKTKSALSEKVTHCSTMTAVTAETKNEVVLYVGATTDDYTQGVLYKPDYTEGKWVPLTYTIEEINALISAAGHFKAVETLPTTDIETNVIYLVPKREEVSGYTATDNTFYVSTGTDDEPAYDHYDENGNKLSDTFDANEVKSAIEAGTYTAGTKVVKIGQTNNIKDEYINLDGTTAGWEKIGDTKLDLSDYAKSEDLVAITSAELAAMWED